MPFNLQSVPIDGLSIPQVQALACLAAGLTIAEVSRDLDIARQTIYNWQKEPKFLAALNAARQVYADELRDQMLALSRKALKRLETIIDDPKSPPSIALKAALAVLNRPQFPEQGWNLPANVNTPRQDRIQEINLEVEVEMKQAELENLKRKLMMAKIKADKVGQNLTPSRPFKAAAPPPVFVPNLTPTPPVASTAAR
jgi:hypothetical protein